MKVYLHFYQSTDVTKHEIGLLITNMWPLILRFNFLSSPAFSSHPSSLFPSSPPCLVDPCPPSYPCVPFHTLYHFSSTHFLFFSAVTLNSVFSQLQPPFIPLYLVYFLYKCHPNTLTFHIFTKGFHSVTLLTKQKMSK